MGIGLSAIIVFCQALVNKYRLSYMFGKFLLKLTDFLVGKFRGLNHATRKKIIFKGAGYIKSRAIVNID